MTSAGALRDANIMGVLSKNKMVVMKVKVGIDEARLGKTTVRRDGWGTNYKKRWHLVQTPPRTTPNIIRSGSITDNYVLINQILLVDIYGTLLSSIGATANRVCQSNSFYVPPWISLTSACRE